VKTEDAYRKVHKLLHGEDNTFHLFKIVIEMNGVEFTSPALSYSQTLEALERGTYHGLVRVEHKYLFDTVFSPL
jgi:hypothetical protein